MNKANMRYIPFPAALPMLPSAPLRHSPYRTLKHNAGELLSGAAGNTAIKTEQAERLILDLLADGKTLPARKS
jgi:hypothetical protein